jgi:hypothetical protein
MSGSGREYWRSVARIGAQVAEALDYATGQGILHRDVKPSNILLDAQGDAWVTDFGLAKAAADENLTHTAEILGTLRYMAPERFDGRSDLRSDVYALGVTLYEMLTLTPAYDATDPAKIMKQVMMEAPAPPRTIDAAIPRDLETVALKAMAREPERRYPTAGDLAADLRRFLEDRPIQARRARLPERLGRWCRRNPVVASLVAGVAVLLVGGALASLAAAIHSGQLAAQERLARDEALREQTEAEKNLAQAQTERTAAEAARLNEAVLRTKAEDDRAAAEKSEQEAAAAARLAQSHSQNAQAIVDAFVTGVRASAALRGPEMHRLRRDLLLSALPFYEKFIAAHAGDETARPALAGAHFHAGEIHSGSGNPDKAHREYQAAVALYAELAKAEPDNVKFQIGLARSQAGTGATAEAELAWERMLAGDPGNRTYQSELARARAARGAQLAEAKRNADALAAYERAQIAWTAVVEAELDNADSRAEHARTTFGLAHVLAAEGRLPDALRQLTEGIKHARHASDFSPHTLEYGRLLAAGYDRLAELHRAADQADEALTWHEQAVQLWQRLAEGHPTVAAARASLHASYLRLAACQKLLGHDTEADDATRAAAQVLDTQPRQSPEEQFQAACVLALVARDAADSEVKKATAAKALDALRQAVVTGFRGRERIREEADLDTLRSRQDFRDVLIQADKAEKERLAARTPAVVEAERRKALRAGEADLAAGLYAVGLAQLGLAKYPAAAEALAESAKLRQALLKDDPDNAVKHRGDLGLTHVALGEIDMKLGRSVEALAAWRTGLDLIEGAATAGDRDIHWLSRLAQAERRVGNAYAEMGLWDECAELWAKSFEHRPSPSSFDWYYRACTLLYRRDLDGYRQHCEKMLKLFKQDNFQVVRACTIGPDAVKDMAEVVRRAELEKNRLPQDGARNLNLRMAYYRAARPKDALAVNLLGAPDLFSAAHLALIYDAAGERNPARDWLDKVDRQHEDTWRNALVGADVKRPTWLTAFELMRFEVLRREAHELLDGKAPADDPWQRLHVARVYHKLGMAHKVDAALAATRTDNPAALLARGRLLVQMARSKEALVDFDRAVALEPKNPIPLQERARCYVASGEADKAAADFAAALELAPAAARNGIADDVASRDDVFARTAALRPKDRDLWHARLRHCGSRGRWREAATAASALLEIDPADAYTRYQLAPLLLEIDDRDGYVKAARAMLERYGDTDDPTLAERTAKNCLLVPDGVADLKKLAQLATQSVTGTEKHAGFRWFKMCKALADYRQAEYADSLAALKSLNPSADGFAYDALVYTLMAMAHQRLNQPREARQALKVARAIVERKMPRPERGQLFVAAWDDWLRCRILLREAAALIEGEHEKQP